MTWRSDCPVCDGEGKKGGKKCPECYPDTEWRPGGSIYDENGDLIGGFSGGGGYPISHDDKDDQV